MTTGWILQSFCASHFGGMYGPEIYCVIISETKEEAYNHLTRMGQDPKLCSPELYLELQQIYDHYEYWCKQIGIECMIPRNGKEYEDMLQLMAKISNEKYTFSEVPILKCVEDNTQILTDRIKQLESELMEEKLRPPELGGSEYEEVAKHFDQLSGVCS